MAQDAVQVAPHVYTVILENERVRLLEGRLKPDAVVRCSACPRVAVSRREQDTSWYSATLPPCGSGGLAESSTGRSLTPGVTQKATRPLRRPLARPVGPGRRRMQRRLSNKL